MHEGGYKVIYDPSGDFKPGVNFSREEVRCMMSYCSFTEGTILECNATGNRSKIVAFRGGR